MRGLWQLGSCHLSFFHLSFLKLQRACSAGGCMRMLKPGMMLPMKSTVPHRSREDAAEGFHDGTWSVKDFPQQRIRNFSIIAHIDHGKSTLADRMMEYTGAIRQGANRRLDTLQVEKERGLREGTDIILGVLCGWRTLFIEFDRYTRASQGIQAQTVANFFLAFEQDLAIIPVLNKIDMPAADPEKVAEQLEENFDLNTKECSFSAKTGLGVNALLQSIVERIPAPKGDASAHTRMLVFDAYHDEYRGVVCLILVVDGKVQKGDKIASKAWRCLGCIRSGSSDS
eukprot:jgi/Picre1/30678/NNA_006039.t1